jgi:hypothetical protein
MDTARVHPETLAGDPFVAAKLGEHRYGGDDRLHICDDGWVTLVLRSSNTVHKRAPPMPRRSRRTAPHPGS